MGLEDFFTVTEMRDGLVAVDRVDDLISAMKKDKDSAVKDLGETARKWSAVANTLTTTENVGVLKHFVRLGGLYFLEQWLQEAQQYYNDTSESSVEESTCELLRALEKLVISNETHVFSGIMVSVKNLIGYKSLRIQDRVKALFDLLNQGMEKESDHLNATATVVSSSQEHPAAAEVTDEDGPVMVLSGSELQYPRSSDCSQSESVAVAEIPFSNKQNFSDTTLSQVDEKDVYQRDSQGSSIMSIPFQPSVFTVEESSKHPVGGTSSVGTRSSPVTVESNVKTSIADVMAMKDISSEWEGTKSADQNLDRYIEKEISYTSSFGPDRISCADTHAQPSVKDPSLENDVDGKEREFCVRKTLGTGVDSNTSTVVSNPSDVAVGFGLPEHSRSQANLKTRDQNDGIYSNVSQDLSVTDCTLRKTENVKTRFPGESNDVEDFALESTIKMGGSEDSATMVDISKPRIDMKASDEIVKSRLDMELDFVEDDALDVARQVAKDFEREVVDYREPLCSSSSSKKNSESRVVQPGSPDSVNGEQDQPMAEPQNEMPVEQNFTSGVIFPKGDRLSDAKHTDKPEDFACNNDLSQVTEAAQKAAFEKSPHGFDLNEESYSQEMDQPRAIVSSSIIAAATPKAAELDLPGGPSRHFDGKPGCSGSAAITAFCPAPNLRISDAEKAISVEGSSSSKQRPDFLDIDLNVAAENIDGAPDLVLAKMPVSSGLPSGESSVEVSSKRPTRLTLDLNHTVDNGDQSSSPVSWSSSKQPSMRFLDLNDNPSVHETHGYPSDRGAPSSQGRNLHGGIQVDGPCISIMGTRVPINREEVTPQTRSFLPNGPVPVSSMGANAQSGGAVGSQYSMAYVPPYAGFGYNGLGMEPYMSAPSAMYGSVPVPYTVDPRETPMGQQMMGSFMTLPHSYPRPPFPMSMPNAPSGFNWIGPPQPNLGLSSGYFLPGVESRESGTSRPAFIPGQANMMEEQQMGSASQAMSLGTRVKRKEPDNGCDPYLGLHRRQPPWL